MIKDLTPQDIDQVVCLHIKELPGFLKELGDEFLKKFYQVSLSIPEVITILEKDNEQILGFATYCTTVKGLYRRIIIKDIYCFGWLLLRYFITHMGNSVKLIKTLTYPGFSQEVPELLTIAVGKKYQGRGIGAKLFQKVTAQFQERGIKQFQVSVYDRLPANGFYKKMGGKLDRSFQFLGEKMNYYSFIIPLSSDAKNR